MQIIDVLFHEHQPTCYSTQFVQKIQGLFHVFGLIWKYVYLTFRIFSSIIRNNKFQPDYEPVFLDRISLSTEITSTFAVDFWHAHLWIMTHMPKHLP